MTDKKTGKPDLLTAQTKIKQICSLMREHMPNSEHARNIVQLCKDTSETLPAITKSHERIKDYLLLMLPHIGNSSISDTPSIFADKVRRNSGLSAFILSEALLQDLSAILSGKEIDHYASRHPLLNTPVGEEIYTEPQARFPTIMDGLVKELKASKFLPEIQQGPRSK